MTAPADVAAFVADLPDEHLPALLALVAARMAQRPAPATNGAGTGEDRLLTVEEAAGKLATTRDWLRRHGEQLGIIVRLSEGQVRYSAAAIDRYIASRVGALASHTADRL